MRGRDLHRILVDAGVLEHAHWFELETDAQLALDRAGRGVSDHIDGELETLGYHIEADNSVTGLSIRLAELACIGKHRSVN